MQLPALFVPLTSWRQISFLCFLVPFCSYQILGDKSGTRIHFLSDLFKTSLTIALVCFIIDTHVIRYTFSSSDSVNFFMIFVHPLIGCYLQRHFLSFHFHQFFDDPCVPFCKIFELVNLYEPVRCSPAELHIFQFHL